MNRLAPARGRGCIAKGALSRRVVAMSESDQFLKYAEEALLWVSQSKTEREKQLLLELACTWTRAAVASERTMAVNGSPAQARL